MKIIELSKLGDIEEVAEYLYKVPRRLPSLTGVLKHDASTEKQKLKFFLMPWYAQEIPKYEILAISSYVGQQRRILMIDLSGIFSKGRVSSLEVVFFQDWCVWQKGMSIVNGGSFAADDSVHLLSRHIFALLLLSLKPVFSNERNLDEFKRNSFRSLSELLDFIILKNDAESIKRRLSLLRSTLTQSRSQTEEQKAQMDELINFFETNEDWLSQLTKEEAEAIAGPAQDESTVLSPKGAVSRSPALVDRKRAVVASGGGAVVKSKRHPLVPVPIRAKGAINVGAQENAVPASSIMVVAPAVGSDSHYRWRRGSTQPAASVAASKHISVAAPSVIPVASVAASEDASVAAPSVIPVAPVAASEDTSVAAPSVIPVAPVAAASGGANDMWWESLKRLVNVDTYIYSSTQLQQPSFPLLTGILEHKPSLLYKEQLKYLFIIDCDGIDTLQSGILVISFYAGFPERKRKMWVVDLSGMFFLTILLSSQQSDELKGLIRSGDVVFFKDWCFSPESIGGQLERSGDAFSLFSQNVFLLLLFSLYLIFPHNESSSSNLLVFKKEAKKIMSLSDLLFFITARLQNLDIMTALLYIVNGLTKEGMPRELPQENNSSLAKKFFDDRPSFLQDLICNKTISDLGDEDEGSLDDKSHDAKRFRADNSGESDLQQRSSGSMGGAMGISSQICTENPANLYAFFPASAPPVSGEVAAIPLPPRRITLAEYMESYAARAEEKKAGDDEMSDANAEPLLPEERVDSDEVIDVSDASLSPVEGVDRNEMIDVSDASLSPAEGVYTQSASTLDFRLFYG